MSEMTRDLLRAIVDAPASRRDSLVNDFIASRMGLFRQIANGLCRNFGVSVDQHGDDFASLVSMEAFKMVTEVIEDPEELERVEVWEGMLKVRSKQIVRNFLDKEMTPASEMSSTMRRVRMLNSTRDAMRLEMKSEPTDKEIVERHNKQMYAQRSNPVKQGVLATVEDLQTFRHCADVADHDFSDAIDSEFVLHPTEGPKFIRLLVEKTKEYNDKLGTAAEIWLSGIYRTEGAPQIASVDEIAEQMGISRSTARVYVRKIKDHAIVVMADEFGITADDI